MLLTLTTTMRPATDLGYLLHKHPDRHQEFPVTAGTAHVFYPVATAEECTVALLLDVDPIALVRRGGHTLGQYVNDRPYAATSMLAVALGKVFRTAMTGRCDARPELATVPIPLRIHVPALPCRGGADLVERLFAPLGWTVDAEPVPLDPPWGDSRYSMVTLTGVLRLSEALNQLYVLIPVLGDEKHYWVSEDEIDKLLRAGQSWLATHPERALIIARALAHQGSYVRTALDRLADVDDILPDGEPERAVASEPLRVARRRAVVAALRESGARRVLDLGCGEGELLRDLLRDNTFTEILGVDVAAEALAKADSRLPDNRSRDRVTLRQSALTYADPSLAGYDAAVLMEVIEHVDQTRLPALEYAVFAVARPGSVIVTTPNVEYNARFEALPPGAFRHADHRFEWTRAEFQAWAERVGAAHGYRARFRPVGPEDPEVGPPTQLAVLTRTES